LAEHAEAVYGTAHDFFSWALDRGCVGADIIERGSTQVGITYTPERIVIAARGSSQWGDWGENLLAFRWAWRSVFPAGKVHAGFLIQARRVGLEFTRTLSRLRNRYPDAEVYITGHSLGGALCHFLARLAELVGARPAAVYTFEAPRAGNETWARWYDGRYGERTWRVVAIRRGQADIVTRVPPSALGWRHVGRPMMLHDGVPYGSEEEWQTARAAHPVRPLAWWRLLSGFVASLEAHRCGALVAELRAFVRSKSVRY
jgi:hypothetical protein